MPIPVLEQIARRIKDVAASVTTANGYETDVSSVVRPSRLGGFVPHDGVVVLAQEDPERSEDHDLQGNPPAIAWMQPFTLDCLVRRSDTSTSAADTDANTFRADVEKALMADNVLTSYCVERHLGNPSGIVTADGSCEGVRVVLNVLYRVSEEDPYVNRAGG